MVRSRRGPLLRRSGEASRSSGDLDPRTAKLCVLELEAQIELFRALNELELKSSDELNYRAKLESSSSRARAELELLLIELEPQFLNFIELELEKNLTSRA